MTMIVIRSDLRRAVPNKLASSVTLNYMRLAAVSVNLNLMEAPPSIAAWEVPFSLDFGGQHREFLLPGTSLPMFLKQSPISHSRRT